jgi:hypothetical protein
MALTSVLLSEETQRRLGEKGLDELAGCIWPMDCQTCGTMLGDDPPALCVDELEMSVGPVMDDAQPDAGLALGERFLRQEDVTRTVFDQQHVDHDGLHPGPELQLPHRSGADSHRSFPYFTRADRGSRTDHSRSRPRQPPPTPSLKFAAYFRPPPAPIPRRYGQQTGR